MGLLSVAKFGLDH